MTCFCGHAPEDHSGTGECQAERDQPSLVAGITDTNCPCACYEAEPDLEEW